MSQAGDDAEWWATLGGAIRRRRLSRGASLVDLASLAELSQPFLSQVENGRARPSLLSLRRIAQALETTPQALFAPQALFDSTTDAATQPTIVRAGDVPSVAIAGSDAGTCRLLLAGDSPVHLLEFDGLPDEFLDYFEHDGFEVVHVTAGSVEIEVDGAVTRLGPGDSMAYASSSPHRFRSIGTQTARVLLFEAAAARRDGQHVTTRLPRRRRAPATTATTMPSGSRTSR